MDWLKALFEKHYFFRRCTLLIELWMCIYVTELSYNYMLHAADTAISAADTVANMAALQAPIILLLRMSFKDYNEARTRDNASITITDSN